MRAAQLRAYDGVLHPVEIPVPVPGPDEVLVKIAASPINPSDLMFIRGLYGIRKKLPVVGGFEGSGTVVAAGASPAAQALLGVRVACPAGDGDGTWAEYMKAHAASVMPLAAGTSLEQGSMLVVNPLSAFSMVDMCKAAGGKALVQTAAASQLGRMVIRLAQREGVATINVVRRQPQVELLTGLGATHVLSTADTAFDAAFREVTRTLDARLCLDAVGGPLTGRLLHLMPRGSRVVVYGGLDESPCQVNPADLIFGGKKVEGFWLSDMMKPQHAAQMQKAAATVQALLPTEFRSEIAARFPLQRAPEALAAYAANMTAGKILLVP